MNANSDRSQRHRSTIERKKSQVAEPPFNSRYRYDGPGECLGGELCGHRRRLEIAVDPEPIGGIRSHAQAGVGDRRRGRLRVLVDGQVVASEIDVPEHGRFFELEVDDLRGRYLIFEASYDEEVVVENVEVRYGDSWVRHRARD